jgi:PAS domain S-box-containing protein
MQCITLFNPSAERIFGYSADEVLGRPLDLLIPPRHLENHRRFVTQFVTSSMVMRPMNESGDIYCLRKNGEEFPAEASISKFVWDGVVTLTVRLRDISERHEAERRLHVQYTVAQVLAEADSLDVMVRQTLQAIGEGIGADISALWQVNEARRALRYVDNWHSAQVDVSEYVNASNQVTFVRGAGLLGRVWATGQPIWLTEITSDTTFMRSRMANRLELQTALGIPIRSGNTIVSIMEFFWRQPRRPDLGLSRMLDALGSQIGNFMERKRAEAALRESEARFRELAENIDQAFWIEDQVRTLNLELEQRVNERTRQLERALARTKELYEISQRIGLVRTSNDVLDELLSTSYLRSCSRASIAIFDHPWIRDDRPPKGLELFTSRTDGSEVPVQRQQYPAETEWMLKVNLRNGPVVIDNVDTDPQLGEGTKRFLQASGTCSAIMFPLIAGGEWFGVLILHFAQVRPVEPEDIRHIQGLVDQAAAVISNQRLLEAEAQARREAERANELRLRFLGMISHELRTPLTSIKGFTTTLLASDVEWDEQTQHEFISIINQEADKLTDMIEQLLDLSRLEAGSLAINPEAQPLREIVDNAMPQLQAITRDHHFTMDIPDELPQIRADRQRVAQVLTNLVSNAAKYSASHTDIVLAAHREDGFVQVDVSDQGVGIPVEERSHVFEAFQRGEDEQVKRIKGAGLGLAICKGLIEAHGGRIWIQEREGPGTTVSFTLPTAA